MNGPAQAEEVQHTVYLSSDRNWTAEKGDNSFYEDKVFFLKDGRIGMNIGGRVVVKTIEAWASPVEKEAAPRLTAITIVEKEPHKLSRGEITLYQMVLDRHWFLGCPGCEGVANLGGHDVTGSNGTITVAPSILCGCGAHYFIEQNKIRWC